MSAVTIPEGDYHQIHDQSPVNSPRGENNGFCSRYGCITTIACGIIVGLALATYVGSIVYSCCIESDNPLGYDCEGSDYDTNGLQPYFSGNSLNNTYNLSLHNITSLS